MNKYSTYTSENIQDFNLDHIFDCGQCFRWDRQYDGSYTGIAMNRVVNMKFEEPEGRLIIENCTEKDFENIWKPYLDLDRDYGKIKKTLMSADNVMPRAIEFGSGIRILRQDLWETILSFIISQNNNIPRIKGCINRLSSLCGKYVETFNGNEYYAMPSARTLSKMTTDDLAPVRLGYRASYIIESAKTVVKNGLPQNQRQLLALHGVGPKVANCISLFGMGRYESFPVDIWVKKVMNFFYNIPEKNMGEMTKYAKIHFGEFSGFAQQYLFYYMRENDEQIKRKIRG